MPNILLPIIMVFALFKFFFIVIEVLVKIFVFIILGICKIFEWSSSKKENQEE